MKPPIAKPVSTSSAPTALPAEAAPHGRQVEGVICPLATPLLIGERINNNVLRQQVETLVNVADGIFVNGSSGEFVSLTDDEADHLVRSTVELVQGRTTVYCGVGDVSLKRTLERARRLDGIAVDFVVATPPFYYSIPDGALADHFSQLADSASVPVVLYNIPQNTHNSLTPQVVIELSAHENIVGLKDSAGDLIAFQQIAEHRSPGFALVQGREELTAVSAYIGADGVCCAACNFAAPLFRELWRVATANYRDDALRLQHEVNQLCSLFRHGYWLSALKTALQVCGYDVGDPVHPLPASTPAEVTAITDCLRRADLWLTPASGAT